MTCTNCDKPSKFTYQKNPLCSNRCLKQVFGKAKMSPESVLLHTIRAGCDAYAPINKDYLSDWSHQHHWHDRALSRLTKAILKTSKKPVKAKYTHNEGALPREWR